MPKRSLSLVAFDPLLLSTLSRRAERERSFYDASAGVYYEWREPTETRDDAERAYDQSMFAFAEDLVLHPPPARSEGRWVYMPRSRAEQLRHERFYGRARGWGGKRPDVEHELLGSPSPACLSLAHDGARRGGRRV